MAITNEEYKEQQAFKSKCLRAAALAAGTITILLAAAQMGNLLHAIDSQTVTPTESKVQIVAPEKEGTLYQDMKSTGKKVFNALNPFHQKTSRYTPHPTLEHTLLKDKDAQEAVAEYIATEFKTSRTHAETVVASVVTQSKKYQIDPLLLLGLIAQESSFQKTAQSGYGAQGLTQVVPAVHSDSMKALGIKNIKKASVDAQVEIGTKIFSEYLDRTGKIDNALQSYNLGPKAALQNRDPSYKYTNKVLTQRDLFKEVLENRLQMEQSSPAMSS